MSLYHEAAEIFTIAIEDGGSLKSLALGKKGWKSDAKTLFALTTESAKWSDILTEVVENGGLLALEKNLSPTLALLLAHDLLLSKKGVALPAKHGLHQAISRHKARLTAELTKARIRRGVASLDDLRKAVNKNQSNAQEQGSSGRSVRRHPRWIRINTLKTTLEEELTSTFSKFARVESLTKIATAPIPTDGLIYIDAHIPNLVAIASIEDITTFKPYKTGKLILQEKASCFPAYLIDPSSFEGDVIDACSAPGNKTTHLAAILSDSPQSLQNGSSSSNLKRKIIACEKDARRSETLSRMIHLAGAEKLVTVKPKQDFLKLDPLSPEFSNVTALLLDPSCSGSGIVGRDEASVKITLPSIPENSSSSSKSKKRKRDQPTPSASNPQSSHAKNLIIAEEPRDIVEENPPLSISQSERLSSLSTFQLRLLKHAMSFPSARRISYSTCSLHAEENEKVVVRALMSSVARESGWKILKRGEQVQGLREWKLRGELGAVKGEIEKVATENEWGGGQGRRDRGELDAREVAEGCIRCEKGGGEGTMGFFVGGFVRDGECSSRAFALGLVEGKGKGDDDEDEEEWSGFGDD